MAAGISRSVWLPKLQSACGIKRDRAYRILHSAGMRAPYRDQERAMLAFEKAGVSTAKYRALLAKSANGHDTQATAAAKKKASSGKARTMTVEAIAKMKSSWDRKLIPRLAALLPEGKSTKGKVRARRILAVGGYPGPRWNDEPRAIEIFRAAGIDVSTFEHENAPIPSPTATPEEALTEMRASMAALRTELQSLRTKVARAERALKMLEQFENHWFDEVEAKRLPRQVPYPLEEVFFALNEMRAAARR